MILPAILATLLACPAPEPSSSRDEPVVQPLALDFGVYQTDKATEMYKRFTPLLEQLSDGVGRRLERPTDIRLTIFKSYDDAIKALVDGTVDFVHFGPSSYILAKKQNPQIELLAMEHDNGEKRFKGVVIVAKDSSIRAIEDLKGKSFAFGDPNSTIGRFLVQAVLVEHGIHAQDLAGYPNLKYFDRHDQVAAAVQHGDFDAGSVKYSTFKKANEKDTLRVIAQFENVTKPIVARAGLDKIVAAGIKDALFELKDPKVLKELGASGFIATSDDEYQFVRDGMKKADAFDKSSAKN
jgi:phosphonate transport system substrate-binding protein